MTHARTPRPRRGRLGITAMAAVLTVGGIALTGCGDISRADASSQLASQLSTNTKIPASVDKNALTSCIISKLFDSGKFSSDEIQQVLKANSSSDLNADLNKRYDDNVNTPCIQQVAGQGGSSSGGSASSGSASSTGTAASSTDTGSSSSST